MIRSTRRICVALMLTTVLFVSACGANKAGGKSGSFKVGIKFDQPGLGQKEGGDYVGFDVDVARYVAKKLGHDPDAIEFVQSVSAQRENMLKKGQVDIIVATYSINEERKTQVDFAGPYFVAGQDLLVRVDDTSITGPETLNGKRLCSVKGSTPAQRITKEYSDKAQLQEYETYSDCLVGLNSGALDALTTDDIILAGYAAQTQNAGKLRVLGKPFSEENYGIGVKQGSEDCEKINAALKDMIDDGSWEKALKKHAGEGYTPNQTLNPPTPGGHCSATK